MNKNTENEKTRISISRETQIKIYNLILEDYEQQFEQLKENKPKLAKPSKRTDEEKEQMKNYRRLYQKLSNNINFIKKQREKVLKGEQLCHQRVRNI